FWRSRDGLPAETPKTRRLEATPGIEPGYADLQSAASPLRHVAPATLYRTCRRPTTQRLPRCHACLLTVLAAKVAPSASSGTAHDRLRRPAPHDGRRPGPHRRRDRPAVAGGH